MANIALVTESSTDAAATSLRDVLIEGGHSCQIIQESSSNSLLDFSLIISSRSNGTGSANTSIVNAFNAGIAVICGFSISAGSGVGSSASSLVGRLGFASEIKSFQSSKSTVSLTSGFSLDYPQGTVVQTNTVDDFTSSLENNKIATGAVLYFNYPINPTNYSLVAIASKGSSDLLGGNFPAACAFAGFLYKNSSNFTVAGKKLIYDIVDKVLAVNTSKTHTISGYVLDDDGLPLTNKVLLYKHSDGVLSDEATPDLTGKYEFKVIKDTNFFVVCTSTSADKNFKIHSFVQGVLV